jgi:mono/diheme cytochrome c family protein
VTARNAPPRAGRRAIRIAVVAIGLGLATACVPTSRGPALEPLVAPDARVVRGERVFAAACHACHPHALAGLGPGIIDRPVPGWLVRLQVRVGVGVMPAFSEVEIDEDDLDALVAYLAALRRR